MVHDSCVSIAMYLGVWPTGCLLPPSLACLAQGLFVVVVVLSYNDGLDDYE